jgi:cell division transport system permease protein
VRLRLFVAEALRSTTANLSTTAAATVTVLIGMFVLGLCIALGSWVLSWTGGVEKDVVAKVFFKQNATTAQVEAVRAQLAAMPEVKTHTFVSKEDALAIMEKKHPELTENLASNPFGHAFTVKPKKAEQVSTIAERLSPPPPGVDKVDYQAKTTRVVLQFIRAVTVIVFVVSAVLLVASTLLIANTIRLSLFSRRREIEVMKLVGATNWFVRGPFMLEGLICGLAGSIAAVLLLLLAKELVVPRIPVLETLGEDARILSFPWVALALVLTSLFVGAAGSGITLRRFLRI